MTTLEDLRNGSNWSTFPYQARKQIESAACFYAGAFLGRNDVIYVYDHLRLGGSLLLVDTDEAKLVEMHEIYGGGGIDLEIEVADAYPTGEALILKQRTFDLVTIDPWTQDIPVALLRLPVWWAITKGDLVIGVTLEWFKDKHLQPTEDDVNAWLARSHWNGREFPTKVVSITKRSEFRGGVYWLLFSRS